MSRLQDRERASAQPVLLSVIELKNAADENADIWAAYNQLQTYKNDISDLFNYNTCLVISDGIYARLGSLSANENDSCGGEPLMVLR